MKNRYFYCKYNTSSPHTENNNTYVFSLVENRQKYNFTSFLYLNNTLLTTVYIYISVIAVVTLQKQGFYFFGGYMCVAASVV